MQLRRSEQVREYHWLCLLVKLLDRRLTAKLRFAEGRVYNVDVSMFFAAEAPSRAGPVRGDLAVAFSCSPGEGAHLAAMVVDVVEALQVCLPGPARCRCVDCSMTDCSARAGMRHVSRCSMCAERGANCRGVAHGAAAGDAGA